MFIKEALQKLKSHTDLHRLIVGDFNTLLLQMDRSSRQKLNREILNLTDIINQKELTDIYKTFKLSTKEYTFFSAPQRIFSKIDHILSHKANLNR
jgi:exonuclease III